MVVLGRRSGDSTNGVLQLAYSHGVMGFSTISNVDDLTVLTIIANRQCAKQFAVSGVVTNHNAFFGYAGVTRTFNNHTAGDGFATQRDTSINAAAAILTNCDTAFAGSDSVITHRCSAST